MHNKSNKIDEDLFNEITKIYERFSLREDFDPGEFAYYLARSTMAVLYDSACSPLAATAMVARALQHHVTNLRREEKQNEDNFVGDLIGENGISIPVDKSQKH